MYRLCRCKWVRDVGHHARRSGSLMCVSDSKLAYDQTLVSVFFFFRWHHPRGTTDSVSTLSPSILDSALMLLSPVRVFSPLFFVIPIPFNISLDISAFPFQSLFHSQPEGLKMRDRKTIPLLSQPDENQIHCRRRVDWEGWRLLLFYQIAWNPNICTISNTFTLGRVARCIMVEVGMELK